MDKDLYRIAADACSRVYDDNITLGTTEFNMFDYPYHDGIVQVLAFAGTNEKADWWKNLCLWADDNGIKKTAAQAAHDAAMHIAEHGLRKPQHPLYVCGHSKGGAEAIGGCTTSPIQGAVVDQPIACR